MIPDGNKVTTLCYTLTEAAPVERVCKVSNQEEVNDPEMYGFVEYTVSSGEVSSLNAYMEELSDMSY